MSTRCTIGYGEGYHLYEECFDQDKVWLELEGKVSEIEYSSIRDGCLVVGIDVVVRAVEERHPEIDHRAAGQDAARHGLTDAHLDRRNVFARDRSTHDLVDELEGLRLAVEETRTA